MFTATQRVSFKKSVCEEESVANCIPQNSADPPPLQTLNDALLKMFKFSTFGAFSTSPWIFPSPPEAPRVALKA